MKLNASSPHLLSSGNKKGPRDALAGLSYSYLRASFSAHRPGVAALEQCLQIALPLLRLRVFELLVYRTVVSGPRDRIEHSDRGRQRRVADAEQERERKTGCLRHRQGTFRDPPAPR